MYDPSKSLLRVACVGDSRAILGRWNDDIGKYDVKLLSTDQTGFNIAERERIEAAHPGESKIIDKDSGRLLGIAVTRAFGDVRWKWTQEQVLQTKEKFWGSPLRPNYETPPYMTAEPVVTETEIKRGKKGDFVIMASDGIWDQISSAHAVDCVGQWLRNRAGQRCKPTTDARDDAMPETLHGLGTGIAMQWRAVPIYFVCEDDNAATHLIKNVFGGSRKELFCGIMSTYPPMSRNVRDDVTVQVIFFGDIP